MVRSLVHWPHPALRTKCKPTLFTREPQTDNGGTGLNDDKYMPDLVDWSFFQDTEFSRLLDDMFNVMHKEEGIGLAANQVGECNHSVAIMKIDSDNEDQGCSYVGTVVCINPEIVVKSDETCQFNEGCLSFPDQRVLVTRPRFITLRYISVYGRLKIVHLTGVAAICIQHEIDHLNGKAIIDHADLFKREAISKQMKMLQGKLTKR